MEPGSDEAYRDQLPGDLLYEFNNLRTTARRPSAAIEGPQICTQAEAARPRGRPRQGLRRGPKQRLPLHARRPGQEDRLGVGADARLPGRASATSSPATGSPRANDSDALFLRLDMPGHIKHKGGDTFSEVYLSYHGTHPRRRVPRRLRAGREVQLPPRAGTRAPSGSSAPTTSATRRPARTAPGWPG